MPKTIKLHKGLDLNLKGKAAPMVRDMQTKDLFALCPDDFHGFKPKVVVKEGDTVLAGDALFVNKDRPELQVVSPVSGTVKSIERGERRKVLSIVVEAAEVQEAKDFGAAKPTELSGEEVKNKMLQSGVFAFLRQRPYDVTADPTDKPKAIVVSAFSKMPLSQDFSLALKGREDDFQTGIDALSKLSKVFLNIAPGQESILSGTKNAEVTIFDGPNPSGNVGVQINHLCPVNKGEVVWTMRAEEVIFVGNLFNTGKVDFHRVIAFGGSEVKDPCYYNIIIGQNLKAILENGLKNKEHVRIINGNPLVGTTTSEEGFLAAHTTEVSAIPEGDNVDEVLGWIMPRLNEFSTNRSYFSWLQGKKEYDLDARIKGGERHIIMSGEYDKVLPMDILGGYLIKAILVGDIDKMEQLGIYEVAPEDFAVAEFVDSSKLELQRIVREGLDMLRKELA